MESLPHLSAWALVLEKSRQLRTVPLRRAAACAKMSTTDPFTPLGPYCSREMDWEFWRRIQRPKKIATTGGDERYAHTGTRMTYIYV